MAHAARPSTCPGCWRPRSRAFGWPEHAIRRRAIRDGQRQLKRVPELRDLSDDHHTALVLARRCRQAAGPDAAISVEEAWQQLTQAFASHLEPHFRIEEKHLLPALEALGETDLAARIRGDHASLRDLAGAGSPSRARLERFGSQLEAHVRFEERRVFESTQHRLPAASLRAIAEACRSIPRTCPVSLLSG